MKSGLPGSGLNKPKRKARGPPPTVSACQGLAWSEAHSARFVALYLNRAGQRKAGRSALCGLFQKRHSQADKRGFWYSKGCCQLCIMLPTVVILQSASAWTLRRGSYHQ